MLAPSNEPIHGYAVLRPLGGSCRVPRHLGATRFELERSPKMREIAHQERSLGGRGLPLTAWQGDSLVLLCVGLLIAATAVVRAIDMGAYQRREKAEVEDRETIRRGLKGNICRCTGYENIVRAIERVAEGRAGAGAAAGGGA
mgnify:CR=1 FL=1